MPVVLWQLGALSSAEDLIKESLKSPRSYNRYSGSITSPILQDDGSYRVTVELRYGATNSFGAEVTNDDSVYVYFKIDLKNCTVQYTKAKLTPTSAFMQAFGHKN